MTLLEKITNSDIMSKDMRGEIIRNKANIKNHFDVDEFDILTFVDTDGTEYIMVDINEVILCSLTEDDVREIGIETIV